VIGLRPISCNEVRRPVAEFMRESIVFVRCRRKNFTFAISSLNELLIRHRIVLIKHHNIVKIRIIVRVSYSDATLSKLNVIKSL